jgi:predicted nucleic acid-binding protein
MGFLIDSSVLISWERNRLDLQSQLARHAEDNFAISAITASEAASGPRSKVETYDCKT